MQAEEIVHALTHWAKDTRGTNAKRYNKARIEACDRFVTLWDAQQAGLIKDKWIVDVLEGR